MRNGLINNVIIVLQFIWHTYLYQPLLNVLIEIYDTLGQGNLGWSIVIMTIGLRILLIPLSFISERNAAKYESLSEELDVVGHYLKDDPVGRRETVRMLLKRKKIRPWASVLLLAIQFLVLVLLYRVFVGGMSPARFVQDLYPWVIPPDVVNTVFYGIDIAHRSLWSSLLVAVLLYIELTVNHKKKGTLHTKGDIIFRYVFPSVVFLVLYSLPAAKALFVLTSMAFSAIFHLFRPLFEPRKAGVAKTSKKK